MKMILSSVVTIFAALSITSAAFSADDTKPVIPAGPVYATVPDGVIHNDAEKAAKARKTADNKDAKAKAETEARESKAKADKKASEAKAKADAAAAKDASSAPR